jgi:acetyl-CoA C-acetyltransferase
LFDAEVAPISVSKRKGVVEQITRDEEFTNIQIDKLRTLKPAFKKDGTVTAANASTLNDGAAAMIVMSGKMARERGLTPLFRINGFGDAAKDPVEFTTAPSDAVPRALKHANMTMKDVQFHEINEAFSIVALVNARYVISFSTCKLLSD